MAPWNRGKKKARGSTSMAQPEPEPEVPQPPPVAPLPGYLNVVFRDEHQRNRFESLTRVEFCATRFLDTHTMNQYGMGPSLQLLFNGTGLGPLYGMREHTYRDLTLEFLSSYVYNDKTNTVAFRLRNFDFHMTTDELGIAFGFTPEDYDDSLSFVEDVWTAITGIPGPLFNVSNMKISSIHDPRIKILIRTVAGTIFGRENADKTNRAEVVILGAYLDIDSVGGRIAPIGSFMGAHFDKAAHQRQLRRIAFGGVITFLAKQLLPLKYNVQFDPSDGLPPFENDIPLIDDNFLVNRASWVEIYDGNRFWRVNNDCLLPLPLTLPPIAPRGTYLLDGTAVPRGNVPNPSNFDPQSFENQRHNFEMVDHNLMQHFHLRFYIRENLLRPTDSLPSWHNENDQYDQSRIFDQYGVPRASWGPDYHRTFGGAGGQFLAPPRASGSRPARAPRARRGRGGGNEGAARGGRQGDGDDNNDEMDV